MRPRVPPFIDPPGYARHRPEETLLYRLVEEHYPAFLAARDSRIRAARPGERRRTAAGHRRAVRRSKPVALFSARPLGRRALRAQPRGRHREALAASAES